MKYILILLLLLSVEVKAQKDIAPTDQFTISGQVTIEKTISIADLSAFKEQKLNDLVITNHLGEPRGTIKNMKGVLLRDILGQVEIKSESPKVLSEFYLSLIASDDYKVVFSWNEIFNSETGNHIFLVTEKDGKRNSNMNERILIITESDFKTGRRHVKGLEKILVERIK